MRYLLLGAALMSVLVAACDSKPKQQHGAMTPAGTDMVAPETPADQPAPAETDTGNPPDSAPATNP